MERPADISPDGPLALADAESAIPHPCIFARIRNGMSDQHRAELDFMVESPKYTTSLISRSLNKLGHKISRASVEIHLKGACTCSH